MPLYFLRTYLRDTLVLRCGLKCDGCKARGGRIVTHMQRRATQQARILTATLRDEAILGHFGVARRLFGMTKLRGSRLELASKSPPSHT